MNNARVETPAENNMGSRYYTHAPMSRATLCRVSPEYAYASLGQAELAKLSAQHSTFYC